MQPLVIEHGFRMRSASLGKAFARVERFRATMAMVAFAGRTAEIARVLAALRDDPEGIPPDHSPLQVALGLGSCHQRCAAPTAWDMRIILVPSRSRLLGVVETEQPGWASAWLGQPGVMPYDLAPSRGRVLSMRAWVRRGRHWRRALRDGQAAPADVGLSVQVVRGDTLRTPTIDEILAAMPSPRRRANDLAILRVINRRVDAGVGESAEDLHRAMGDAFAWGATPEGQAAVREETAAILPTIEPITAEWITTPLARLVVIDGSRD